MTNIDIPEIAPMGRLDLYAYLGLVRVMEPETEILMRERADRDLIEDEFDSPHSRPWFVSMHASEFPGDPSTACSRYLAYRMMNFVSADGAMPPWVTTTGVLGKAGELDLADAWFKGGRLLAIPEDPAEPDIHQLGFVDAERWMTASTDLPILPKGWRRPHIVETKCKADDVVEEMLNGRLLQKPNGELEMIGRGPDARHSIQLKATIGKAHDYDWGWVCVCKKCWRITSAEVYERLGIPGGAHPLSDDYNYCWSCKDYDSETFNIEPPTTGEIYYWSRSWPRKTKSFYFEHDQAFMDAGLDVLAATRQSYIDDEIPERPDHFQWSLGACKFCNFKIFCREDSGVPGRKRKPDPKLVRTKLTESAGVDHTRTVRPHYDPDVVRARVFEEWA